MDNHKSKPESRSVKEHIIEIISQDQSVPKRDVKIIINEMFANAKAALLEHGSVEISGYGRYYFNKRKAFHRINAFKNYIEREKHQLDDPDMDPIKKEKLELKFNGMKKKIIVMENKYKMHEHDTKAPY